MTEIKIDKNGWHELKRINISDHIFKWHYDILKYELYLYRELIR